jgi:hypothetical protein
MINPIPVQAKTQNITSTNPEPRSLPLLSSKHLVQNIGLLATVSSDIDW